MKVVIADDEPLARERLRSLLAEQAGVEVVAEAENGEQALHACAALQPDLVLLDIAMPGLDGLEAARHLATFDPRPAVVFCTAYDAHALSAFEAAAIDYLMKPVRPNGWPPRWSVRAPSWPGAAGIPVHPASRPAPCCARACAAACG